MLICAQTYTSEQEYSHGVPPVAHTEYINSHKHDILRIERVADLSALPFRALFQLYEFEFVPHTSKEVTHEGLYELDIWSSAGVDVYLLYCGKTPIGFAVVNLASMINGDRCIKDIAEFFIMPSHRRQGHGLWLAHAIFERYPGKWEVRQIPNHQAIRDFWRKAIRTYVGDKFVDLDMTSSAWVGPIQTFNTADKDFGEGFVQKKEYCNTGSICGGTQYSYILKASSGKGIGVFALHDLSAGSSISEHSRFKVRLYKSNEIPQELKGHCTHLVNGNVIAPERFDQMPIFWYLNHSDSPNVIIPEGISIVDDQWLVMQMYALRDIKAGEELFINYNELGEPEELKEDFYRV